MLISQKKLLMRLDDGEDGGEMDKNFFNSLQNAEEMLETKISSGKPNNPEKFPNNNIYA